MKFGLRRKRARHGEAGELGPSPAREGGGVLTEEATRRTSSVWAVGEENRGVRHGGGVEQRSPPALKDTTRRRQRRAAPGSDSDAWRAAACSGVGGMAIRWARGDLTGGRRRAACEQGNRATERWSDGWGHGTVLGGSSK
jgi:hypothetical protein